MTTTRMHLFGFVAVVGLIWLLMVALWLPTRSQSTAWQWGGVESHSTVAWQWGGVESQQPTTTAWQWGGVESINTALG